MRLVARSHITKVGGRLLVSAMLLFGVIVGTVPAAFGAFLPGAPELVSADANGSPGSGWSYNPSISDDGRHIAFDSTARLTSNDKDDINEDGERDVYLRDTRMGTTTLVTPDMAGASENDRGSRDPSISDDGRYIVFISGQDFVADDDNGGQDMYVYDAVAKTYTLLDWWGDGSVFGTDDYSYHISGDGKWIVLDTRADLVTEDTNGGRHDIYVMRISTGLVKFVSEPRAGGSETVRGSRDGSISDDGRYVAFFTGLDLVAGDTNGDQDLYIYDMQADTYTRADLAGDGTSSAGEGLYDFQISGDGSAVVFEEYWEDIDPDDPGRRDVYAWMRETDETVWISRPVEDAVQTDRGSRSGCVSDDGRYVTFFSGKEHTTDDVNQNQDLYVYDMMTDAYYYVGLAPAGTAAGPEYWDFALSGDGSTITFAMEGGSFSSFDNVYLKRIMAPTAAGAARVAGSNRYATSVAASMKAFPGGAGTVVIATGENWPDALGGSALAGAVRGPILLTETGALPSAVKAEIERLGAKDAYIVGGYGAVSAAVESELEGALPGMVKRLAGADRYGTSKAVANEVITILGGYYDGTAIVATGMDYPDAMAAAPLASGLGWPILLANPATGAVYMPAATDSAIIAGGAKAVTSATESGLKTKLGAANVVRKGGSTRYQTAAMIAEHGAMSGLMWNGVGIATGQAFPDALAGGAALGQMQAVMLLTPTASLDPYAQAMLDDHKAHIDAIHFLGGTAAVSPAVEAEVKQVLGW